MSSILYYLEPTWFAVTCISAISGVLNIMADSDRNETKSGETYSEDTREWNPVKKFITWYKTLKESNRENFYTSMNILSIITNILRCYYKGWFSFYIFRVIAEAHLLCVLYLKLPNLVASLQ